MKTQRTRRQIQERLHAALIEELNRLDLPDDGRHLSRVFRALTHAAIELMQTVGIPDPVTSQLLLRVVKKSLKKSGASETISGAFGPIAPGKA